MEILYFNYKEPSLRRLSNYYGAKPNENLVLFIDGKSWPTVEHYIQAQKYKRCEEYMEIIRAADSPVKARALGLKQMMDNNMCLSKTDNRKINDLIRLYQHKSIIRNWSFEKDDIMLKAIRAKVSQNQHVFDLLCATRKSILIQANRSAYWGLGVDGYGQNKLGRIYMRVRAELPP